MRHFQIKLAIALLLLAVIATAFGCGTSASTRFYQLSTTPGDDSAKIGIVPTPMLGIGPITLPAYLDRAQVVVREDAHGLELREFNQWAEPLESNFVRVFSENLAARLGTDRIALHPWGSSPVDLRIEVRVIRFECDEAGKCTLEARWIVESGEKRVEKASKHEAQATGDTDSVAEMVAAMSRALGALSDEIAADIKGAGPN